MSDGDYDEDGSGMALDVDGGDDNMGLSLDLTGDDDEEVDEEELRAQAGFNSPKKTGDSDEDVDAITPRTAARMRQEAGINSPKQDKKMGFGDDEDKKDGGGVPNALAGLVTQVQRPDPVPTQEEPDGGEEPAAKSTDTSTAGESSAATTTATKATPAGGDGGSGGGMCACLFEIFNCCSPASSANNDAQALSTHQTTSTAGSEKSDAPLVQPPPTSTPTPATGAGAPPTTATVERQGETMEVVPGVVTAADDEADDYAFESEESSTEYPDSLLPPPLPEHEGKKCMVLDLDETLVHSSFRPVKGADFIIPVEIDGVVHRVYVMKRPYVDEYLVELAKDYEIVIFTASLSKYADPLLDTLDIQNTITHRLFRESCVLHSSAYVKDLRRLGRKLRDIIIVDNSPASYLFQPKNAVPVASWFDDKRDTQLLDWLPFAQTTLKNIFDVRWILDANHKTYKWLCQQAHKDLDIYTPPTAKRKLAS